MAIPKPALQNIKLPPRQASAATSHSSLTTPKLSALPPTSALYLPHPNCRIPHRLSPISPQDVDTTRVVPLFSPFPFAPSRSPTPTSSSYSRFRLYNPYFYRKQKESLVSSGSDLCMNAKKLLRLVNKEWGGAGMHRHLL